MRRPASALLLALAGPMSGCAEPAAGAAPLVVFASASLSGAMQRIAADFERANPGVAVALHCAGTPHLLMQAREGAPVDVFVAASSESMALFAAATGLAAPAAVCARNALAIVVPAGNPKGVGGLADLQRDDLLVALCGEHVPAGAYARRACRKAGVRVRSRSDEPSVKAVVTKVRLGELDAGVVYVTDLLAVDGVEAVAIPPAHNVDAELAIAAAAAGRSPAVAARFVAWVLGGAGQAALAAAGFRAP